MGVAGRGGTGSAAGECRAERRPGPLVPPPPGSSGMSAVFAEDGGSFRRCVPAANTRSPASADTSTFNPLTKAAARDPALIHHLTVVLAPAALSPHPACTQTVSV